MLTPRLSKIMSIDKSDKSDNEKSLAKSRGNDVTNVGILLAILTSHEAHEAEQTYEGERTMSYPIFDVETLALESETPVVEAETPVVEAETPVVVGLGDVSIIARHTLEVSKDRLAFENVTVVYSGTGGCNCGCKGKYYAPSTRNDVEPQHKISDKMVKKIIAILAADPQTECDVCDNPSQSPPRDEA